MKLFVRIWKFDP